MTITGIRLHVHVVRGTTIRSRGITMFQDPHDEEKLCQVLKAYVGEWGPENVIIAVPRCWSGRIARDFGKVRLRFETDDLVSISVEYACVPVCHFDVKLLRAA
jgi:hypothetical protein